MGVVWVEFCGYIKNYNNVVILLHYILPVMFGTVNTNCALPEILRPLLSPQECRKNEVLLSKLKSKGARA